MIHVVVYIRKEFIALGANIMLHIPYYIYGLYQGNSSVNRPNNTSCPPILDLQVFMYVDLYIFYKQYISIHIFTNIQT